MNPSQSYLAIAMLALLAGGAMLLLRETPAKAPRKASLAVSHTEPVEPSAPPPLAPTATAAPAPVVTTPARPSAEEASFMTELRELRAVSPGRALELARSAEQRFGESAEAAERSWIIVKSLSELGRHEEARAEGRKLVERYRDTRWGKDVYRHLFVNPPTHPSERGYGKALEGE